MDEKIYDFFISHKSEDRAAAEAIRVMLEQLDPSLTCFLDCWSDHPLMESNEWATKLYKDLSNSRFLIFLATDASQLQEGYGWVYREVSFFHQLMQSRHQRNCSDLNIAYFGVLMDGMDLEDVYRNPEMQAVYRGLYAAQQHLFLEKGADIWSAKQ